MHIKYQLEERERYDKLGHLGVNGREISKYPY
jgi:hypothetical protein